MVMAVEDEVVGALKKSEKSKKRKERNNDMLAVNPVYIVKDVGVEGDKSFEEETLTKMKSDNEGVEIMKKKKKSAGDYKRAALMEDAYGITVEKAEKKKRIREVQSNNIESHAVSQDTANDVSVDNSGYVNSTATEMLESKRKHEKKARIITDGLTCAEGIADFSVNETQASGVGNANISRKQVKDGSKDPKRKNSKKKVRFSNELKVFPESNVPESGKGQNEVVELIREEKALILEHVKLNGNEWKSLADKLGRHEIHVRDTWRRIYLPNLKKGHWSQDEYQNLFDLVNTDLQWRILEEKRSKHGMLRDNIYWTEISNKLSTRSNSSCCSKWYYNLTSPMVAEGTWSASDDYRLIDALYTLDATCIENVEWDNLLEHRSGELCLKRWKQMVIHIGNHWSKPFSEQVEVLAKRYCPSLIEVREAWDNKPVVP
nr:DNA-binding protein REB1-like [Ipomoea batatas]